MSLLNNYIILAIQVKTRYNICLKIETKPTKKHENCKTDYDGL